MKLSNALLSILFALFLLPACGGDDHDDHGHGHGHHGHDHDPNEVITTVKLHFTPAEGGDTVSFTWADPENDGSPTIDPINLTAGTTYAVTVEILNELENPAEDVTVELRDELDEHQFFFTGESVSSPASESSDPIISQAYTDMDENGDPVGLSNTIEAVTAGSGDLTIMLRHMPPVNNMPVKTSGLAALVKNGQTSELPGDVDIEITFPVTVE